MPLEWWHQIRSSSRSSKSSAVSLSSYLTIPSAGAAESPQATAARAGGSKAPDAEAPLVHVRFTFDRTPIARMHAALHRAAELLPRRGGSSGSGSSRSKVIIVDASTGQRLKLPRKPGCVLVPSTDMFRGAAAGRAGRIDGGGDNDCGGDGSGCRDGDDSRLQLLKADASALQLKGRTDLNPEQRMAVAAMLQGAGRTRPFVLFGPPGTGKTVTLVETALQLMDAFPKARLLLAAPQNYSADVICANLAAAGVSPVDMVRLNDPRRPVVQLVSCV